MRFLTCCLFPTTVLLVDDDLNFLEDLHLSLKHNNTLYKLFDRPVEALDVLSKRAASSKNPIEQSIQRPFSRVLESRVISANISDLHKITYDPKRFDHISTVVVDYDMPSMNGLDFCAQIKDPNIQKIILTGKADEAFAVKAFNEGLIHGFIKKEGKITAQNLNEHIAKCQSVYFRNIGEIVLNAIENYSDENTAINDEAFLKSFDETLSKYKIVEYYMIESIGSFLMIDERGKSLLFFTRDADRLEGIYQEAKDSDDISHSLKQGLKNKELVFCYSPKPGEALPPPSQWPDFLEKSIHSSNEQYYHAVTSKVNHFSQSEIRSFKDFSAQFYK